MSNIYYSEIVGDPNKCALHLTALVSTEVGIKVCPDCLLDSVVGLQTKLDIFEGYGLASRLELEKYKRALDSMANEVAENEECGKSSIELVVHFLKEASNG